MHSEPGKCRAPYPGRFNGYVPSGSVLPAPRMSGHRFSRIPVVNHHSIRQGSKKDRRPANSEKNTHLNRLNPAQIAHSTNRMDKKSSPINFTVTVITTAVVAERSSAPGGTLKRLRARGTGNFSLFSGTIADDRHSGDGQGVQAEAYRSGARNEQPERRGRQGVKVLAGWPIPPSNAGSETILIMPALLVARRCTGLF